MNLLRAGVEEVRPRTLGMTAYIQVRQLHFLRSRSFGGAIGSDYLRARDVINVHVFTHISG